LVILSSVFEKTWHFGNISRRGEKEPLIKSTFHEFLNEAINLGPKKVCQEYLPIDAVVL